MRLTPWLAASLALVMLAATAGCGGWRHQAAVPGAPVEICDDEPGETCPGDMPAAGPEARQ